MTTPHSTSNRRRNSRAERIVSIDEFGFVKSVKRVRHVNERDVPVDKPAKPAAAAAPASASVAQPAAEGKSKQPNSKSKQTPKGVSCPYCNLYVSEDNFSEHIRQTHLSANAPAPIANLGSPQPERRATQQDRSKKSVRCPHCNASVKTENLDRHIRRIHGVQAITTMRNERRDPEVNVANSSASENTPGVFEDQEARHDGGRYLGYFARENGQFGSIPEFDDLSEESDAD